MIITLGKSALTFSKVTPSASKQMLGDAEMELNIQNSSTKKSRIPVPIKIKPSEYSADRQASSLTDTIVREKYFFGTPFVSTEPISLFESRCKKPLNHKFYA